MKILANENFPLKSVKLLEKAGFDIKAIAVDKPGISDKEVIQLAEKEKRTIITFDKDYGELIYKHGFKPEAGVIFMRLSNFKPEDPGIYLLKVFKTKDLNFYQKLTVIDKEKIRQRIYSKPKG